MKISYKQAHAINQSNVMKLLVIFSLSFFLHACASNQREDSVVGAGESTPEAENVDSFEGFNRAMFSFNDTLDRWLLKPIAKGYDWVLPEPVKASVGNFYGNLGEVTNIVNDGLQWKWKQAANDTARLLMNSTVGVLGLFDVATKAGLEKNAGEDFSQTLATWGVSRGSYLVLPFMGPTTVRGVGAMPVDWYSSPVQYVESDDAQLGLNILEGVHGRSELLATEELATGDRYLFVREVFIQRLEYLENDGQIEDNFGDDFGEDDEYGGFE